MVGLWLEQRFLGVHCYTERINVAAVQGFCAGGGSYGTIVFLLPAAASKAATVLGGR